MPTANYRPPPPAPATFTVWPRRDDRLRPSLRGAKRRSIPVPAEFPDCFTYARNDDSKFYAPLRIIRRVGFAEDVNGITRLQLASGEGRIGVEREIADRKRADSVKYEDRDAFHQVKAPRCATPAAC